MSVSLDGQLAVLADIVRQFGLTALDAAVRAFWTLSCSDLMDLAVLGQLKSDPEGGAPPPLRHVAAGLGLCNNKALAVELAVTTQVCGVDGPYQSRYFR